VPGGILQAKAASLLAKYTLEPKEKNCIGAGITIYKNKRPLNKERADFADQCYAAEEQADGSGYPGEDWCVSFVPE
jgi:hypothetical protein